MHRSLDDWLQLLERRHHTAIDLGLDRAREVWQRMDSPLPAARIFVVAGTNGKGSTVANICGMLDGLGYRYGSYTTPHIHDYNERVQLQGRPVSDDVLIGAFEKVEAALGDVSLSYFEFGTLAAFQVLSEQSLDFAVMEIGLGGRLDAVNLLDADCAVITPIGLDHQEFLGEDLDSIGFEKAGVIRQGKPLVCGQEDPPATVLGVAAEREAPVRLLGSDFGAQRAGDVTRYRQAGLELELPLPVLAGPHQFDNLATAVAALLQMVPDAAGQPDRLAAGLRRVRLHGRFERVAEKPVVWIDVGHNALAAAVVVQALREQRREWGLGSIRCVFAMLADKDAEAAAAALAPEIATWYCAGLETGRGQSGEALARRIADIVSPVPVRTHGTVASALQEAISDSAERDGVLVFGSFFTADEALQAVGASTTGGP
jgi:dihydrofolate synthase/folylpolyglutamate synthase